MCKTIVLQITIPSSSVVSFLLSKTVGKTIDKEIFTMMSTVSSTFLCVKDSIKIVSSAFPCVKTSSGNNCQRYSRHLNVVSCLQFLVTKTVGEPNSKEALHTINLCRYYSSCFLTPITGVRRDIRKETSPIALCSAFRCVKGSKRVHCQRHPHHHRCSEDNCQRHSYHQRRR